MLPRQRSLSLSEQDAKHAERADLLEGTRDGIETETRDIEAGITGANTPVDATTWEESPTQYRMCCASIFLFTILIVIPGLLFIAIPSLFIILGYRENIADLFTNVYAAGLVLCFCWYTAVLVAKDHAEGKARDTLRAALAYMSAVLGTLIGVGWGLRVEYSMATGIWYYVGEAVLEVWGGEAALNGTAFQGIVDNVTRWN